MPSPEELGEEQIEKDSVVPRDRRQFNGGVFPEENIRIMAISQAIEINRAGNSDSVIVDAEKFEQFIIYGKIEDKAP